MRSGLRSSFSRPRKTNGATAKDAGGFQTPTEKYADFSSPAVRSNYEHARFFGTRHAHDLYDTQVRTARHMRRPASPASSAQPSTSGGGGNGIVARKQNPMETTKGFPVPCFTLLSRLSLASQEAVEARRKPADMKSVDRTVYAYKKRFSALVGEDWIAHVDALETHRANKFQWTARQFYYGLLHTLVGRAERTATAMEDDIEEVNLLDSLPDWFECEMLELRQMVAGKLKFAQLKPRTKVAVLISHFEEKFQKDTADLAEERFRFALQGERETIESWGQRLNWLRRRIEKHGRFVSFDKYLKKWKTGTLSRAFTSKL